MQKSRSTGESQVGIDECCIATCHPVVDGVHRAFALAGGAPGEAQHADMFVGIEGHLVVEIASGLHQWPETVHAGEGGLHCGGRIHHHHLTPAIAQYLVIAIQKAGLEKHDARLHQVDLARMLVQRIAQVGHDNRAFLLEGAGKHHQAEVVVFQDQHEAFTCAHL
ncbi:hypothetical protein D3C81_601700 [compost metagenome]